VNIRTKIFAIEILNKIAASAAILAKRILQEQLQLSAVRAQTKTS